MASKLAMLQEKRGKHSFKGGSADSGVTARTAGNVILTGEEQAQENAQASADAQRIERGGHQTTPILANYS